MEAVSEANTLSRSSKHLIAKENRLQKTRALYKRTYSCDPEHDIKYRGPLSYRYLRIIAWVIFALAQLSFCFKLGAYAYQDSEPWIRATNICAYLSAIPFPLFLMANFATILQKKNNIKLAIRNYLIMTIGMGLLVMIIALFYIARIEVVILGSSWDQVYVSLNKIFNANMSLALTFNIFVDLLLCTISFFFLFHKPKSKLFEGRKIYIFRLLAILPLLYEIAGWLIKVSMNFGYITLPFFVFPFLPSKPVLTYVAFGFILIYFKIRKHNYDKFVSAKEGDYEKFAFTNRNSLFFALIASLAFFVVALIDFGGAFLIIYFNSPTAELIEEGMLVAANWGFGRTSMLVFAIPFILLFSYTKTHEKTKLVDTLVPIFGCIFTAFVLIEGTFEVLINSPIWKR